MSFQNPLLTSDPLMSAAGGGPSPHLGQNSQMSPEIHWDVSGFSPDTAGGMHQHHQQHMDYSWRRAETKWTHLPLLCFLYQCCDVYKAVNIYTLLFYNPPQAIHSCFYHENTANHVIHSSVINRPLLLCAGMYYMYNWKYRKYSLICTYFLAWVDLPACAKFACFLLNLCNSFWIRIV